MHPEIIRDQPGSCPLCGMNLVPVEGKETEKHVHHVEIHEKEKLSYAQHSTPAIKANKNQSFQKYTCPMHPQIVQDAPGKCPLCGMTLVPLVKSDDHGSHTSHSSGIADFKKRFYAVLVLTVPIMLLSEMIQHWLRIHWRALYIPALMYPHKTIFYLL